MRLEYQDNIDRYLLNKMSVDERNAFEAECAVNQELKEQLEHTKNVKTVISERSELLAKFQEWDKELDTKRNVASHNKRTWIYGISGVAAAAIVGYFLLPTSNNSMTEGFDEPISMNTYNKEVPTIDSVTINCENVQEQQKELLAKNDADKGKNKESITQINDEHVYSFGTKDYAKANPPQTDPENKELEKIIKRKKELERKISNLERQLTSGEIDQITYESNANLLKQQKDQLCWLQSSTLLNMERKYEALAILDELRKTKGLYQHKADSLYNVLKK